jgi:N6-adenosine-specific RNA methylase IME4
MNELVPPEQCRILALLESGRDAIAQARTADEVKLIRDQAQTAYYFLKQREYSFDAQQDAAEIKVRAERRLGQLVAKLKTEQGGNFVLPPGVLRIESHRWQKLAALSDDQFEDHVKETREAHKEVTTQGVYRLARSLERKTEQHKGHPENGCTVADLRRLIADGRKFGTIYADPPWRYDNQGTRAATDNHYVTMTIEDLAALPIADLAAEKSHLHLWTTDSFLEPAIALLKGWGYERRQTFIWCKPQLGIGNYWRSNHEYMLLGIRGGLTFADDTATLSYIELDRTKHSAKPLEVRRLVEKVSPGPRLELFGRECVDGWVVWGNQIDRGLFDDDIKAL